MIKNSPLLRSLVANPSFTLAFIVTLGLGIGANTAIFSLVNGVLLKPLPYPGADRILHLKQPARLAGVDNRSFSFVEADDYRKATTLDEVVEFGDWTFNVLDRGEPHRAVAGLVTSNFFQVLGLQPALGRTLAPEDEVEGAQPVAVLTYDYWQRVFGGDPRALGETLDLTVKKALIVGVLRPGSHYASNRKQDFYSNYASNDHYMSAAMQDERAHRMTDLFARLAPGATLEAAREELKSIMRGLHEAYPDAYPASQGYDIAANPWLDELTERARPNLLLLLAISGFVLILACANVANLTLTRLIQRERELAIRSAVGASAGRLRLHLLKENLVLAAGGAIVGLLLARGGLDMLVSYTSRFTNRVGEIGVDGWVLAFTLSIACGVAILFACTPGLSVSGDPAASLASSSSGRATGSFSRRRLQRLLVLGQMAISFILLASAGLLLRTLFNLYTVDPGFDLANVLTLESPDFSPYDADKRRLFARTLLDDLDAQPEVQRAALASRAPLRNSVPMPTTGLPSNVSLRAVRTESDPPEGRPTEPLVLRVVSGSYFDTIGTPLLYGRTFNSSDLPDGTPAAVINRTMADRLFPGQSALGKRLAWENDVRLSWLNDNAQWADWVTVVGVVADSKADGVQLDPLNTVFLSADQSYSPSTVLVRSSNDATGLAPQVIEKIRALDPNRPIDHIQTLEEMRAESIAPQRLNALLFSLFAALALVIAAVGIYGVLALSVSQRTREIGIRLAIGAAPGRVLKMVLREGLGMAVMGLLVGIAAMAAALVPLSAFLSNLLFDVKPLDPPTFLAVALVLLAVAAAAALGPARRALRVDPIETLKAE